MAAITEWYRQATKSHFIRYGIPFIVCIVAGSFGLKEFASIRYDFRKRKTITNEEAKQYGVKMKTDGGKNIEDAYEELQKQDLDTWENIRGPRPWEDSKTVQDLQRKKVET